MARNQSAFVNWSQYLAARAMYGFVHSLDVNENLNTVARIGTFICHLNRTRRDRAMANIRWCFPELTEDQVVDTVERSYQHMLQLFLVDAIAAPKLITADGWPKYVTVGNLQSAIDLFVRNQPAILISGHTGNWELLASFLAVLGFPVDALARPLDNPLLNRWLLQMREARGARIITKWGAMPVVQQTLRRGGQVAFVADQNAGDQGLFVPFFGRLASTYKSVALLAMRHQVPVAIGSALRVGGRFHYEIEVADVIRPDDWVDQDDPVFYITARYSRAIEAVARQAPEQYLWVHRRWKSRPKFERNGRPMPSKLIRKLEDLPWMTQDEMDLIAKGSQPASSV